VAAKWVLQNQKNLCPSGVTAVGQREGYLLQNGVCVKDPSNLQKTLNTLDGALAGVIEVMVNEDAAKKIKVDAFAWSRKPVSDLKSLLPTQFDSCGQAATWSDNTFGGVLVDGNPQLLMKECQP
jgi:hypothetical protein